MCMLQLDFIPWCVEVAYTPGSAAETGLQEQRRQLAFASLDVISSSIVASQNYTTGELPIQSQRIHGTFLRPRVLGRGNSILGGLVLTQEMRQDTSTRTCSSRFAHLSSHCVSLATGNVSSLDVHSPFGSDPGATVS